MLRKARGLAGEKKKKTGIDLLQKKNSTLYRILSSVFCLSHCMCNFMVGTFKEKDDGNFPVNTKLSRKEVCGGSRILKQRRVVREILKACKCCSWKFFRVECLCTFFVVV